MEDQIGIQEPAQKLGDKENRTTFRSIFRDEVQGRGLVMGVKAAIDRCGGRLRVIKEGRTQEVLEDHPVILLLTHNFSYEVFAALAALPESRNWSRQDVKLLVEQAQESSWFDSYTAPLFNVDAEPKDILRFISRKINPRPKVDRGEAAYKNAASLLAASKHVAEGGMIVMCPEGTRKKDDSWQSGIASLLKMTKKKLFGSDGYVVFCDVSGINLLSFISDKASKYTNLGSPYKNVTVKYSEPISLNDINVDGKSAEEITSDIEGRFRLWKRKQKLAKKAGNN